MAIDIRGNVFCNRGPVIRGGFSDDHIQGTGLVRTKGELVLNGLIKLQPGSSISLGYEKQGRVNRIPRALRVLSSFADPFRRETTVSVGCKLTMLENFREAKKTNPAEDDANQDVDCSEYNKIPLNITLDHIVSTCLTKLSISGAVSIPGSIAADTFDFSSGYLSILSDILYSNSLIGYLDANEIFTVVSVNAFGSGPVLDEDDVIDVSPVRSGDIPANRVIVDYSYNRFKKPTDADANETEDERKKRNYELSELQGELEEFYVLYNKGNSYEYFGYYPFQRTRSEYDGLDRLLSTTTTTTTIAAKLNSNYVSEMLDETGTVGRGNDLIEHKTTLTNTYQYTAAELVVPPDPASLKPCTTWFNVKTTYNPDRDNAPILSENIQYESHMAIAGSVNIASYVTSGFNAVTGAVQTEIFHPGSELAPTEVEFTNYNPVDSFNNPLSNEDEGIRVIDKKFKQSYHKTQIGQQGLAFMAKDIDTPASNYLLLYVGSMLTDNGGGRETTYDRLYGVQKRPSQQKIAKEKFAKDPRESFSDLEFIIGSEGSSITTTYSLPIAPDDEIGLNSAYGTAGATYYLHTASKAPELAREFGRTQQRLTYGHRMGFSVQTVPDKLPPYPAMGISLRLGGIVATYIANAQSWSFDSNGIVASADFLYLGGVGATTSAYVTPSPWAPVQDGITALPTAPAVTTNASPTAANSITTPAGFDANAPGSIFSTLPTNTAPVHAKTITITGVVPAYQEVAIHTLYVRTNLDVTRTLIFEPLPDRAILLRTRPGATAEQFQYPSRTTELRLRTNALVTQIYYEVRDALLRTRVYYLVDRTDPFAVSSGNALPLLGSGLTTTTPTGWTQVFSGNVDDTPLEVLLPFGFPFNGTTYTSFWLSPNGYITFGTGSLIYPGSATSPALPKILINNSDDSMQKVLTRSTTNTFRVRVDGNTSSGGGSSADTRTFEAAFFLPSFSNGYPVVEVRIGASPINTGLLNVYSASAVLSASVAPTPAANSSWVFTSSNATGTAWVITPAASCTPVE